MRAPHQHGDQRQPAHFPVLDKKLSDATGLIFIFNVF